MLCAFCEAVYKKGKLNHFIIVSLVTRCGVVRFCLLLKASIVMLLECMYPPLFCRLDKDLPRPPAEYLCDDISSVVSDNTTLYLAIAGSHKCKKTTSSIWPKAEMYRHQGLIVVYLHKVSTNIEWEIFVCTNFHLFNFQQVIFLSSMKIYTHIITC